MAFVSITRLRVRSWRHLPAFFVQSLRSAWQAKSEIGCLAVAVLRDTGNAFWTGNVPTWRSGCKTDGVTAKITFCHAR